MTTPETFLHENNLHAWTEKETGIEFIRIPGGRFLMGSGDWDDNSLFDERPVHEVELDSFWMARFPVTVAQYLTGVNDGPLACPAWLEDGGRCNIHTGDNDRFKSLGITITGDYYPVTGISWHDATAYAMWLSQKTGHAFSLPTEAQWEFAARSGGKEEKYAGAQEPDSVAWYEKNSDGRAHPVGEKQPNGLGLYDMCGNVCEWCFDLYSRFAYENHGQRNPVNTEKGDCRVVRGGCWNYGARDVRCADRGLYTPEYRGQDLGFRLVCTTQNN